MRATGIRTIFATAMMASCISGARAADCNDPGPEVFQGCLRMAKEGSAAAAFIVGQRFAAGDGTPRDNAQALYWIRKAGDAGDPFAFQWLVYEYYYGRSAVAKDYAQAFYWGKKGADLGLPLSLRFLAYMYLFGNGVTASPETAFHLFERGVSKGDPSSMWYAAQMLLAGTGVARDKGRALKLLLDAAPHQCRSATEAGEMLVFGKAGPRHPRKALELIEPWAQKDCIEAQVDMGDLYAAGYGGTPDFVKARAWYERALRTPVNNNQVPEDQSQLHEIADTWGLLPVRMLGLMYAKGIGGPVDTKASEAMHRRVYEHDRGLNLAPELNGDALHIYRGGFGVELGERSDASNHSLGRGRPSIDNDFALAKPGGPDCARPVVFEPRSDTPAQYVSALDVVAFITPDSPWQTSDVKSAIQHLSGALARCQVKLRRATLVPYADANAAAVCSGVSLARSDPLPFMLHFVANTPLPDRTQPTERSSYFSYRLRADSIVHETGHLFGLQHPGDLTPGAMQYGLLNNDEFTPGQCEFIANSAAVVPIDALGPRSFSAPGKPPFAAMAHYSSLVTFDDASRYIAGLASSQAKVFVTLYMDADTQRRRDSLDRYYLDLSKRDDVPLAQVLFIAQAVHDWQAEQGWISTDSTFPQGRPVTERWLNLTVSQT